MNTLEGFGQLNIRDLDAGAIQSESANHIKPYEDEGKRRPAISS